MRGLCLIASLSAGLLACVAAPGEAPAPAESTAAGKLVVRRDGIADRYVVVLAGAAAARAGAPGAATGAATDAAVARLSARHGAAVDRRYHTVLRGFAATMSARAAAEIAADPEVALVEQDSLVRASAVQASATWGLDRIDQRALPLDGSYTHFGDGAGTTVFVVDTGIRTGHVEFTGRLAPGEDFVGDFNGVEDCNGHGTHVAGTVGGTTFGVAKLTTLVPVRVLDCEGSGAVSGIIDGLEFIAANHPARSVANLSLGGSPSDALDAAIRSTVASGVTVVVAAGNEAQDACGVSPAREPAAITVGASDQADRRPEFSNFGSCVDLSAPGTDITSAGIASNTDTDVLTGTSMASPHVAGAAALVLGGGGGPAPPGGLSPAQVLEALLARATRGALSNLAGSPNLLLHTLDGETPPPPGDPVVAITSPADGAQVPTTFGVTLSVQNTVELDILLDGRLLETLTGPPFDFELTSGTTGPRVLEVVARNAAGRAASDSIAITVLADGGGGGGGGGIGGGNNPPPPAPVIDRDDEGGCAAGRGGGAGLAGVLLALAAVARRRHRRVRGSRSLTL